MSPSDEISEKALEFVYVVARAVSHQKPSFTPPEVAGLCFMELKSAIDFYFDPLNFTPEENPGVIEAEVVKKKRRSKRK